MARMYSLPSGDQEIAGSIPAGSGNIVPRRSIVKYFLSLLLIQEGQFEGWAQNCSNSNIFLKPLFRGNFDPFVNNANLGAIAHTSNGT